jgi:hypothetical protein
LLHLEVSFYGKKQRKIEIFGNFETSPRCHGNFKFKIEHAIPQAMVQSTYVSSFISIEAFCIVSYQFELVFVFVCFILHIFPTVFQSYRRVVS